MKRPSLFSSSALSRLPLAIFLALALAAPVFAACSSDDSDQGSGSDAGPAEASAEDAPSGDDVGPIFVDAGRDASQCLLHPTETDPVGLCVQKAAILGVHAVLGDAGVPAKWSVDTLAPLTDDGGATIHDVRDDVAFGAALGAYAVSAAAYDDTQINAIVASDMQAIAHLVESELATLPADYDGALYMRLRRFAAGLRAASMTSDADAIDVLAASYGRAIYTTYFHVVGPIVVDDDGGSDASDDGGASDDDAGAISDGILGTASGGGFAYGADKAASGALALVDMAARATNGTVTPADAGVDTADAITWSQAAGAVFHHLVTRARDSSGLYFTELQTSDDALHDAIADDGALLSKTQGAIALAYVRIGSTVTSAQLSALQAKPFADQALSIFGALQATPSIWDTLSTQATLLACNSPSVPLETCGSGYLVGLDSTKTIFDTRKDTTANARLFAALHRSNLVSTLPESNDLVPMYALFTATGYEDTFFTQIAGQSAFVEDVSQGFSFDAFPDGGGFDGGPGDPLSRYYSASATSDAIEAMNDQWLGLASAPAFFK